MIYKETWYREATLDQEFESLWSLYDRIEIGDPKEEEILLQLIRLANRVNFGWDRIRESMNELIKAKLIDSLVTFPSVRVKRGKGFRNRGEFIRVGVLTDTDIPSPLPGETQYFRADFAVRGVPQHEGQFGPLDKLYYFVDYGSPAVSVANPFPQDIVPLREVIRGIQSYYKETLQ